MRRNAVITTALLMGVSSTFVSAADSNINHFQLPKWKTQKNIELKKSDLKNARTAASLYARPKLTLNQVKANSTNSQPAAQSRQTQPTTAYDAYGRPLALKLPYGSARYAGYGYAASAGIRGGVYTETTETRIIKKPVKKTTTTYTAWAEVEASAGTYADVTAPVVDLKFSGPAHALISEGGSSAHTEVGFTIPASDNVLIAALDAAGSNGGEGTINFDITDSAGSAFKLNYKSTDLSTLKLVTGEQKIGFSGKAKAFGSIERKAKHYASKSPMLSDLSYGVTTGIHADLNTSSVKRVVGEAYLKTTFGKVAIGNNSDIVGHYIIPRSLQDSAHTGPVLPFGDSFTREHLQDLSLSFHAKLSKYGNAYAQMNQDGKWAFGADAEYDFGIAKISANAFIDSKKTYGGKAGLWARGFDAWVGYGADDDLEYYLQAGLGYQYGPYNVEFDWTRVGTNTVDVAYKFTGGGVFLLSHEMNHAGYTADRYAARGQYKFDKDSYLELEIAKLATDAFETKVDVTGTMKIKF